MTSTSRKKQQQPRPIPDERSRYQPAEAEVAFTMIEYMQREDGVSVHRHVIYTTWKELPDAE